MVTLGHYLNQEGQSVLRIFAPCCQQLAVLLVDSDTRYPLQQDALGYWQVTLPRLPVGTRYFIEVDGQSLPDPTSRYQPDGVHGPSMIVDIPSVQRDHWQGVPLSEAVIYELHVGTFTAEGTLAAATDRLDYLQQLGINVIELLPLAAFPGHRNWGYDGVYPYALHKDYGDYAALAHFIEQAHQRGIAVLLDVVYNHFGPEGNYSSQFAPYTKRADTPWGAAINFDEAYNYGIREFYLQNARFWLQEIGFDGLRMDAVSLIFDVMPRSILREITDLAAAIGQQEQREVIMIAEHLRNNSHVTAKDGFNYQTQWNNDLYYALLAYFTGSHQDNLINFGTFNDIVKALQSGFVRDGQQLDRFWHYFLGTPGHETQAINHVVYSQNHDQVGNRPLGERLPETVGQNQALLAATTVLASPFVPMLWMGEEYGETAPFLFFEDFGDEQLIKAVKDGRRAEFAFSDADNVPDPHELTTFTSSKLNWDLLEQTPHQHWFAYYQTLIRLKKEGALGPRSWQELTIDADESRRLLTITTAQTTTLLNFSEHEQPLPPSLQAAKVLAHSLASYQPLPPFGAVIFATP